MPTGSTRTLLVRESFPDPPELETAVSRAVLERVAEGEMPSTLRIHRPATVLAFGPRDRVAPGFPQAVEAARAHGFTPVERLAGGRAAVFHEGTIALSWAVPDERPRDGIRARFEEASGIIARALRSLGVDARVGEVPGEYCPGEHSVNARGRVKLAGLGQRIVTGAAHVGGVVIVSGGTRVRDVLVPVYEALELDWDPETVGTVEDEAPGVTWEEVYEALVEAFGDHLILEPAHLPPEILGPAQKLIPLHRIPGRERA